MFSCCVPVSRGCRLGGARGRDPSRPWRQWVRSSTGRLRSLARRDPKKSTDELGRRLSESRFTCPTELCECPVAQEGHPGPRERVAARRSREAGPGVGLRRPPSPPWPLHRVLVHRSWDEDPEPLEPEPEESGAGAEAGAAPEPDPRASGSSEPLQAGVESGATPAGAWEPASDLGPVRGQQATEQSQLGPASAPASPGSTVPASDPNTVPATAVLPAPAPAPVNALLPAPAPALAPTWMPVTNQGPEGLHGVFTLLYFCYILFQIYSPIPDPDPPPEYLFLFSLILFLFYFLAVTLFVH
ncbi:skin secretory protein xP2-like isoform X2 [Acinonyx jubatus]|uniref:Skin secretory protein xP2-like isoform X2 n=1 Tax=Acinonyx jubatus TaxID=32536 RepID=A0ABM3NLL2_ACIJB|nr:skin secretory protein xP2-like isoform X2 [Acinonyx jubatus]